MKSKLKGNSEQYIAENISSSRATAIATAKSQLNKHCLATLTGSKKSAASNSNTNAIATVLCVNVATMAANAVEQNKLALCKVNLCTSYIYTYIIYLYTKHICISITVCHTFAWPKHASCFCCCCSCICSLQRLGRAAAPSTSQQYIILAKHC